MINYGNVNHTSDTSQEYEIVNLFSRMLIKSEKIILYYYIFIIVISLLHFLPGLFLMCIFGNGLLGWCQREGGAINYSGKNIELRFFNLLKKTHMREKETIESLIRTFRNTTDTTIRIAGASITLLIFFLFIIATNPPVYIASILIALIFIILFFLNRNWNYIQIHELRMKIAFYLDNKSVGKVEKNPDYKCTYLMCVIMPFYLAYFFLFVDLCSILWRSIRGISAPVNSPFPDIYIITVLILISAILSYTESKKTKRKFAKEKQLAIEYLTQITHKEIPAEKTLLKENEI